MIVVVLTTASRLLMVSAEGKNVSVLVFVSARDVLFNPARLLCPLLVLLRRPQLSDDRWRRAKWRDNPLQCGARFL